MLSDSLLRQLQLDNGWTREFAAGIYPYYRATLANFSRGRPTRVFLVVDEMWHAHILCTRDYAAFCAREFGKFVHHERFDDDVELAPDHEDFFEDYGLARSGLLALCLDRSEYLSGGHRPSGGASSLPSSRCSPPGPRGSEVPAGYAMQPTKCGEPEQPRDARCGADKPRPSLSGFETDPETCGGDPPGLRAAACGAPRPTTLRTASCGAPGR